METNSYIPFVLLEGMDLSGKSTMLTGLKKLLPDWKTTHVGLSDDKTMYALAHKMNRSDTTWSKEEIGYLYTAGLTIEIESFTWPTNPTLQDSCMLLRALAHHTAYGSKNVIPKLEELAERHPKFSEAFVFTASITERIKRLQIRELENPKNVNDTDRFVITNPDMFAKMDQAIIYYAKKYFQAEVIDTGTMTVKETLELLQKKEFTKQ